MHNVHKWEFPLTTRGVFTLCFCAHVVQPFSPHFYNLTQKEEAMIEEVILIVSNGRILVPVNKNWIRYIKFWLIQKS
jgi:hypothetical protein